MALNYIQSYHVAGMAVYRCSCGESVIMQTKKVTSGERTGCRNCDPVMLAEKVKEKPKGSPSRYKKDTTFGCVTLTGVFENTGPAKKYYRYEGECTCGIVEMYAPKRLRSMPHQCIHEHHHYRRLSEGQTIGIYQVIGTNGKKYGGYTNYQFRCTVCGHEFESVKQKLGNTQVCTCSKQPPIRIEIGHTYGIFRVLERVYIKALQRTHYKVQCTVCGEVVVKNSTGLLSNVQRCTHKPTAKKQVQTKYTYTKGQTFGSVTLTGRFRKTTKGPYKYRLYEAICTCGHTDYYNTERLRHLPQTCIHTDTRNRKLKVGESVGIYKVLSIKGSSKAGLCLYRFRCDICGTTFVRTRGSICNSNRCTCARRKN